MAAWIAHDAWTDTVETCRGCNQEYGGQLDPAGMCPDCSTIETVVETERCATCATAEAATNCETCRAPLCTDCAQQVELWGDDHCEACIEDAALAER